MEDKLDLLHPTKLLFDENGYLSLSGKYEDYDEYLDAKHIADNDDYREDDEGEQE